MTTRYTRHEILSQLDQAVQDVRFAALDHGYYYPVDARLHGFRDEARWAIVIETVGYNPRGSDLFDVLHCFGNCIRGFPGSSDDDDFIRRIDNMEELQDEEDWVVAAGVASMVVRGHAVPIGDRAGVDLVDLFRSLAPSIRDLLLADEQELRRRLPADLPETLRLDEWHHPDVFNGELPSESDTFVMLADVLVEGRPELYKPTLPPNTHWSNWPEGGEL